MHAEDPLLDEAGRAAREAFSLIELSTETGLAHDRIRRLVVLGLIDPLRASRRDDEIAFPASVLPRIHRMQRLRHDLRLNYASLGLVLDLLERVDALERELERELGRRR